MSDIDYDSIPASLRENVTALLNPFFADADGVINNPEGL
jgi:hypothetical protein